MKVVIIGDVHGRDKWKKQVQEPADLYIFIGDYWDSFDIPFEIQKENFKDILEFYQENPDKVVLLSGNHDVPNYCMENFYGACSGFQNKHAFEIRDLMKPLYENGELQACKILDGHIFSHAGITKEWCERYGINLLSTKNLEKEINELFQKNLKAFCFQDPPYGINNRSYYGDDTWQSLLWVRPYSLMLNQIDGFKQVVGHTQQKGIVYNEMHGIYFVDCQESSDEFLILEI